MVLVLPRPGAALQHRAALRRRPAVYDQPKRLTRGVGVNSAKLHHSFSDCTGHSAIVSVAGGAVSNAVLLTEKDVRAVLPMPDLIAAMEGALAQFSRRRGRISPSAPCWKSGATKRVLRRDAGRARRPASRGRQARDRVSPTNHERSLPSHLATILLLDHATGALVAVVDGRYITEARTAAVSAVSVKHLARPDARSLGIIGSGVQARSHLEAIRHVRTLTEVRVWSPNALHREAFALKCPTPPACRFAARSTAAAAVHGADIVVLATSSPTPVIAETDIEPRRRTSPASAPAGPISARCRRRSSRARAFYVDSRAGGTQGGRRPADADRRGRDRERPHRRRTGRACRRAAPPGDDRRRTSRSSSRLAWPSRTSSPRASCSSARANAGSASDSASMRLTCCDPPSPRWPPWRRSRMARRSRRSRKAGSTPRPPAPSTRPACLVQPRQRRSAGLRPPRGEGSADESAAHRTLASILWLNILFNRGAVTIDHYLAAASRSRPSRCPSPRPISTPSSSRRWLGRPRWPKPGSRASRTTSRRGSTPARPTHCRRPTPRR